VQGINHLGGGNFLAPIPPGRWLIRFLRCKARPPQGWRLLEGGKQKVENN